MLEKKLEVGQKNTTDNAEGPGGDGSGMVHCNLLSNEVAQALQILAVQFNVIVSRSLHPERLHCLGAALKQSHAVGEVDHLVLCPVDDQHWGCDFRHFLYAKRGKENEKVRF